MGRAWTFPLAGVDIGFLGVWGGRGHTLFLTLYVILINQITYILEPHTRSDIDTTVFGAGMDTR